MTIEQIRAALPTHIILTPGVHRWREGDEFVSGAEWEPICWPLGVVGNDIKPFQLARRPIHPHILDNQAFWLRFGGTAPQSRVGTAEEHRECAFLRPDGNGAAAFCVHSVAGRLYDKWLLEQMGDV